MCKAHTPSRPPPAAAALARGEDPCAAEELLNYNLSLNIASVFILLGVSLAGSLGPVALSRLAGRAKAGARASGIVSTAITLGSLFGGWGCGAESLCLHACPTAIRCALTFPSGVPAKPWKQPPTCPATPHSTPTSPPGCGTILATALIHMALPAVMALTSPCLKAAGWDKYEAWSVSPELRRHVAVDTAQQGGRLPRALATPSLLLKALGIPHPHAGPIYSS